MGHINTDATHWRSNTTYSFHDVDVAATFKAGALFTARGFSYSTIKALVRAGLDAPERLLFADGADLFLISGLDEQAFREIAQYRSQFKQTWCSLNIPAAPRTRPLPAPSLSVSVSAAIDGNIA